MLVEMLTIVVIQPGFVLISGDYEIRNKIKLMNYLVNSLFFYDHYSLLNKKKMIFFIK